jgi:hypothetical protein
MSVNSRNILPSKLNQPRFLRALLSHFINISKEKKQKEDKGIEKHLWQRTKLRANRLVSTIVTRKKPDNELLATMISTRLCWISSELATFPGESSFLDSRWWWRGTNTKESKEFVEMPRLVMQLQSYHQECKPMSMRSDAKRRTI